MEGVNAMAIDSLDARRFDRDPSWPFYFQWMQSSILGRTCPQKLTTAHRNLDITDQNIFEILASLSELQLLLGRACRITQVGDAADGPCSKLPEATGAAAQAVGSAMQEEQQQDKSIRDELEQRFDSQPHAELNTNIILMSDGQPLAKDGPFSKPLAEILSNFLNVHYASLPRDQLIDYTGRFDVLDRMLDTMIDISDRILQQPAVSLASHNIETDSHHIAKLISQHCKLLKDYGGGSGVTADQLEVFISSLHSLMKSLPSNVKLLVPEACYPIVLLAFGLLRSLERLNADVEEVLLSGLGRSYLDDLLQRLVSSSVPERGLWWALEDIGFFAMGWADSGQLDEVWGAIMDVFSLTDCEPSPLRFSSGLSQFGQAGISSDVFDDHPGKWPFDLKLVMLLGREDYGLVISGQDYDNLETWNHWTCFTVSDAVSRGYLELAEVLFILLLLQNARYPKTELDPWQDVWNVSCALKEKGGVDFRAFAERISAEYASLYESSHGLLSCRFDRIGRLLSGSQTEVDLLKLRELFETRIMSEDEIVDLYHERFGAELFEALNDISKNELIKFEQLYRQHLYQEKRDDTFDW
ncbi:MAG: hypothetical protein D6698_13740, partial [Gammaproteobacteria bacterium]